MSVDNPDNFMEYSTYLCKTEAYFRKDIFEKKKGYIQIRTKSLFGEVKLQISVKIKDFTYDYEVIYDGYVDDFEFFKQLIKQLGIL